MTESDLTSRLDRPAGTGPAEHAKQVARGAVTDLRADHTTPVEVRLGMLSLLARHVERNIDELVQEARRDGSSWQRIAEVVGITRQGIRKRYDRYSSTPGVARADADEAMSSFLMQRRRLASLAPEQRKAEFDKLAGLLEHLSSEDRANVTRKLEARRQIIRSLGVSEDGDEFEAALLASTVQVVQPPRRRRVGKPL
jgi:hypothetical protein